MDFRQLRNFVAVADHRSFSRAAAWLNLSQPALSVSIKNLEREIEADLFIRTRKDVELTELGAQFLVYARSALGEMDKARALIGGQNASRVRTVRVGLNSILAQAVTEQVLSNFSKEHQNVRLEIEVTTAQQSHTIDKIRSGQWDFGVVLGHIPANLPKDLVAETCMRLTSAAHVRKSHPLAGKRSITLADLADYKWVMSTMIAELSFPTLFTRAGVKRPTILTRVNSFDLLMTLVEAADVVTILPTEIIQRFHAQRFVRLANKDIEFHPNVSLLRSRDREISRPAILLMDEIGRFLRGI